TTPSASIHILDGIDQLWSGSSDDLLDLGNNSLGNSFDSESQAGWSAPHQLTLDFAFEDSDSHNVLLDFSGAIDAGVEQMIELVNPATGKVLASTTTASADGNLLRLSLRAHVQIRITGANGAAASVSGITFAAPS